jgi:hypothetical protein
MARRAPLRYNYNADSEGGIFMALLTCKLCGKIFTSTGGRTCAACVSRIDELYPVVREFLRDHPKVEFNVEEVADAMDVDIRFVQALVDMGYLDRGTVGGASANDEEKSRQKLAKEFESSLQQMKDSALHRDAAKGGVVSYGQQRYGDRDKSVKHPGQ